MRIERDDRELVRQYVEIGAADGDGWTTVETRVTLSRLPDGARLGVTASFGDGLEADDSITVTCASADRFEGDGIFVQLDASRNINIRHWCHSEFPSGEAQEGGVDRS